MSGGDARAPAAGRVVLVLAKLGGLVFVLELCTRDAIHLQLLGGVWTRSRPARGRCLCAACTASSGCPRWAAGMAAGTTMLAMNGPCR